MNLQVLLSLFNISKLNECLLSFIVFKYKTRIKIMEERKLLRIMSKVSTDENLYQAMNKFNGKPMNYEL